MLLIGCPSVRTEPACSLCAQRAPARGTDLTRAAPAHITRSLFALMKPALAHAAPRSHCMLPPPARARRMPSPRLVPPIAAALHPPTAAPVEVCAGDELHTGDLYATPWHLAPCRY
jgi:hypothetical protein